jgi:hypothetical protein
MMEKYIKVKVLVDCFHHLLHGALDGWESTNVTIPYVMSHAHNFNVLL